MRKIGWLISVALLASANSVFAQPPGPVTCPPDVGAALAAQCPCDSSGPGQSWKNHGQYVSCVVRFRNDLRKAGCLDDTAKRTIARCAARSTCGKAGAVLCCNYDTKAQRREVHRQWRDARRRRQRLQRLPDSSAEPGAVTRPDAVTITRDSRRDRS